MTKKIVFHFAVEEEDLPDFLSGLYSLCASPQESSENLAVIEDFFIHPNSFDVFVKPKFINND